MRQLSGRPAFVAVRVPAVTSRYAPLWTALTVVAVGLAIAGLFRLPFVFEAAAGLLLLIAARSMPDRRLTAPAIMFISLCAMLGATFAIVFNHALY